MRVCSLNLLFIKIIHDVVPRIESRCAIKQNMSCYSVNSFSLRRRNYSRTEELVQFSRANSNELTEYQYIFYYMSPPCTTITFYIFLPQASEEGAQTTVHCAVEDGIERHSGGYFEDCRLSKPHAVAEDDEAARNLWDVSEEILKGVQAKLGTSEGVNGTCGISVTQWLNAFRVTAMVE